MSTKTPRHYSKGEEIFNSVSHGVGAVFGIASTAIMLVWAALFGTPICIVSAAIYGFTLILMYAMSTLYHAFPSERIKSLFQIFDHCSIFLLIAGTYTPMCMAGLGGSLGWKVFGVIWGCAVIGIVLNGVNMKRFRFISLGLYVVMGWMVMFTIKPIMAMLGSAGFILLMLGGVMYTVGIAFYIAKKVAYMHSVWHLFVLCGSILHFFCVLLYVLPAK